MSTLSWFTLIICVWIIFWPADFGEHSRETFEQIKQGWNNYE